MKSNKKNTSRLRRLIRIVSLVALALFLGCRSEDRLPENPSGAGMALDSWTLSRTYPGKRLRSGDFFRAFQKHRLRLQGRSGTPEWRSIGPKNIGGRTLCLAFHPNDPDILFAGSAGGGLWKSGSAGKGPEAWERIPTGFPVLGVSAIAINPFDADILYIGTGEVYNSEDASIGYVNRFTRGTYGIGILKSRDGGQSWEKSLDWSYQDMRGVQHILINPQNPSTLLAATTEGILKSTDAGQSWRVVNQVPMAVDMAYHPTDTTVIYATHGSYYHEDSGIFRSTDGGEHFVRLGGGAPTGYTGKALIDAVPSRPDVVYVSAADAVSNGGRSGFGLYSSDDRGETWQRMNDLNVASYQGWYSHDLAIKPDRPNILIQVGIDAFKSASLGFGLTQKSYWYNWTFGQTPVGGPEGPPDYVHADIHRAYFHPLRSDHVYLVTDGGIFASEDVGENWEGRNGGYQTQQFYANFSSSPFREDLAIGGMQDNATAIYTGEDAWTRVLGGDGMCTAIFPADDQILFGSSQFLGINRSNDQGRTFEYIKPNLFQGERSSFNAPFEIAPSPPHPIYAGAQRLYRSENLGSSWEFTHPDPVTADHTIQTIAISPEDAQHLYLSTVPDPIAASGPAPAIFKSRDGGYSFTRMTGLPDRFAMDIAFHPLNESIAYAVFSGFGTRHLYRTTDDGNNWEAIGNGLPDVPTNTLVIDPQIPEHLYVGNDLGVYVSVNEGADFSPYSADLPDAFLVMHLSISGSNRTLRAASHGNGVWEANLLQTVPVNENAGPGSLALRLFPNPATAGITCSFTLQGRSDVRIRITDAGGRTILEPLSAQRPAGLQEEIISLEGLGQGIYFLSLESKNAKTGKRYLQSRGFVKQ